MNELYVYLEHKTDATKGDAHLSLQPPCSHAAKPSGPQPINVQDLVRGAGHVTPQRYRILFWTVPVLVLQWIALAAIQLEGRGVYGSTTIGFFIGSLFGHATPAAHGRHSDRGRLDVALLGMSYKRTGFPNHRITPPGGGSRDEVRHWTALAIGLFAVMFLSACRFDQPSAREKGVREAASAISAGQLKLKEYPPLPSPPGHGKYVQLLRERCGVEYQVPELPPGVTKADFTQEVCGWNDTMRAEIIRKFGPGIFEQLQEEGRKRWEEQAQSKGK